MYIDRGLFYSEEINKQIKMAKSKSSQTTPQAKAGVTIKLTET